jgi:hypothetical protein
MTFKVCAVAELTANRSAATANTKLREKFSPEKNREERSMRLDLIGTRSPLFRIGWQ